MKAKIEWYKEVLELEPGSKVFFPLARLLAENSRFKEAISVLRNGLERHPEFIEARLYLIELLYMNGEIAQCEPQIGQLTRLFSGYPGFWEAWGICAAAANSEPELPLTLKFLALLFKKQNVGFVDVIERGLHTISASPSTPAEQSVKKKESFIEPTAQYEKPVSSEPSMVLPVSSPSSSVDDIEETGEPFSLRTRSMADILAGQGDITGALEIYRELSTSSQSAEERKEIEECIIKLSSLQLSSEANAPASGASLPGKQRMQHLLESLAERLEARAAG